MQGCLDVEFLISHQIASDQSKHGAEWCKTHEKQMKKYFSATWGYLKVPTITQRYQNGEFLKSLQIASDKDKSGSNCCTYAEKNDLKFF